MTLSIFDLTGKVAIVTGGYTGIGYGIAEGLAEAGANIVICARNFTFCQEACQKLEQLGVKALPVRCDITSIIDIANLVASTLKEFGKIDILVNNAGTTGAAKAAVEVSDKEWDETINIDLKGPFLVSRAVAKEMIKQNEGKIINIASYAYAKPIPNSADYCASKSGLVSLTQVMAVELIKHNINVNAICPGYVATGNFNADLIGRMEAKAKTRIPIGRLAQASDIKWLAVYLGSQASNYVVGSAFVIDGGISLR
jgi:NAD(P)-dependent dehydrogenase (short-subunit alcohol dehydrogenase family)